MRVRNIDIKVIKADITELEVDAIVNPANDKLLMGGGVAGAIRAKGGHAIEDEAAKQAPVEVGVSVLTSAGDLKAKHVIHAVTMGMDFTTDEHRVRVACASALACAQKAGLASVALPALGCGIGQFPLIGAAKIMTQEALRVARDSVEALSSLREIVFCLKDDNAFQIFETQVYGYLRHIMEDLAWGPYVTTDIIIELPEGVVVIERSNPPFGWALPGGFVDRNESLEHAARREAKEETALDLEELEQFHTYSDPARDPRFHTVTTVFMAKGLGQPQAGDDAKAFKIVPLDKLRELEFAFDHAKVIEDYLRRKGL